MSSTYTAFDATKPNDTQNGSVFAGFANSNDFANWLGTVTGAGMGWTYAPVTGTGTAEQPQYLVWTQGIYAVRMTLTWGTTGGLAGNITGIVYEVSEDTQGSWAAMVGSSTTLSYDSSGNITTMSNAGGFVTFVAYLIGKVKALLATVTAHIAATGSAVHGLGTLSTQNASAAALTGGTLDGVVIGGSTPANVAGIIFESIVQTINSGTAITTSTAVDVSTGGRFVIKIGVGGAVTYTGLPAAGRLRKWNVRLINGGLVTHPFGSGTIKWPVGTEPTWTASGTDIIEFECDDGATVRGFQSARNSS